ncbi:HDIG domain-containing metalloprotein [Romboutsia sp.]|uniref:HDIG domain-containing metalloprotein n=1 Tax=Romboutsia sp. TaxID=1965302 RepID=UPI003F4037E5
MIPKRVKQFYINATDRMNKEDYRYVKSILNEEEFILFDKLLKSEKKHCVRNAKEIENIIDNNITQEVEIIKNRDLLIKVALLHDIGKIRKKINIIDKSIIVILNKVTKGRLKDFEKSKKVQCYYNHSEYSYEILKNINNNQLFLNIIKNHHNETDDKLINFFQIIDDKN